MSLTYADFCTQCGKRRTRHPSGLCCECRKKLNQSYSPKMACRYCGSRRDNVTDGLCHDCRSRLAGEEHERQEEAIEQLKLNLSILELRKSGLPFDEIARKVSLGRTAAYRRYRMLVPSDSAEKAFAVIV